jgi:hypothetical protein
MKKLALSLAGVLAATAFAPEASAVPVFARQTGMACSACHFQHFPLLNAFGRAFKSSGYTLMGAQGRIEGENLSIPDTLNTGVLTSAYVQNESNAGAANTRLGVPASGGELSLFYGGRISDFAGFLSELGLADASAATGAAKLALLFPVGDYRAGLVAYSGGQGAAYGFEVLNTGAADTHKMMGNGGSEKQHVAATYAASYMGTRTDATGVSLVANGDHGFISVGNYVTAASGAGGANSLPLTYVRAAGIFDLIGWDAGVGIQSFTGDQSKLGLGLTVYKATIVDAQLQGEIGGLATGFYVSYGTAPADVNGNAMSAGWSTARRTGQFADTTGKSSTFNAAVSLEVIPHVATVQLAGRFASINDPAATLAATAQSYKDNALMIGATYELAQNIEIGLNYTTQSGSLWDTLDTAAKAAGKGGALGKTASTLLLEVLF